jgi:hypothetical protein
MLRFLLLALILANGVFYGWSHGLFRAYGFAPEQQSEPQRIAQQIQPELVSILTPGERNAGEAAPRPVVANGKECLQAGPFDETQATALRGSLEKELQQGVWQLEAQLVPARWIIYMGRYPNADMLAKKRAELANMNLKIEALQNPALEIGISLGAFETQALATVELSRLAQRGIRTARVVQERQEARMWRLRVPAVSDGDRTRLEALKPLLSGKSLNKC